MEDDQGEDDRGQPTWTEPAHERDRGPASTCTHHRERYREDSNNRQACDRVERYTPAQIVERRQEQHGAEHEQRHSVQYVSELVDEIRHLAAIGPAQRAEDHAGHEGGDEAGAPERRGKPIGKDGAGGRHDLEPGGSISPRRVPTTTAAAVTNPPTTPPQ